MIEVTKNKDRRNLDDGGGGDIDSCDDNGDGGDNDGDGGDGDGDGVVDNGDVGGMIILGDEVMILMVMV